MKNTEEKMEAQQPCAEKSFPAVQQDGTRLEHLVRHLEGDPVGFRRERFVAGEREVLASTLAGEAFTLSPAQGLSYTDLFARVQSYDAATLPFAEFFAVGCAYSPLEDAGLWTDFLERLATCNLPAGGSHSEVLVNLTLYPAWILLYSAGILAVGRNRYTILKGLLTFGFPLTSRTSCPFALRTSSFDILSQQGQQAVPGREQEHTPLLNHLHEVLTPVFAPYFLSETKFADAFARFEVLLAVAYADAKEAKDKARYGEVSDTFWVPPGRFWWSESQRSIISAMAGEAQREGNNWPPVAAGLFSSAEEFVRLAEKVKQLVSQRGFR